MDIFGSTEVGASAQVRHVIAFGASAACTRHDNMALIDMRGWTGPGFWRYLVLLPGHVRVLVLLQLCLMAYLQDSLSKLFSAEGEPTMKTWRTTRLSNR
jgi:hypothetical protein